MNQAGRDMMDRDQYYPSSDASPYDESADRAAFVAQILSAEPAPIQGVREFRRLLELNRPGFRGGRLV